VQVVLAAVVARQADSDQVAAPVLLPVRAVQRLVQVLDEVAYEEQRLPTLLDGFALSFRTTRSFRTASAQLFSRPSASDWYWWPLSSSAMAARAFSSRCLSAIRPVISWPCLPHAKATEGRTAV
jgi:hypothetical protein